MTFSILIYGLNYLNYTNSAEAFKGRFTEDVDSIQSNTADLFKCVEKLLIDFSQKEGGHAKSNELLHKYDEGVRECSVLGGLSILGPAEKYWGVGRVSKYDRVVVAPKKNGVGSEYFILDRNGALMVNSRKDVLHPKVASLWPWLNADRNQNVQWTNPYTSSVIHETVISAVVANKNLQIFSAHIRLSDLARYLSEVTSPYIDDIALINIDGKELVHSSKVAFLDSGDYDPAILASISNNAPFFNEFQRWHDGSSQEKVYLKNTSSREFYRFLAIKELNLGGQRIGIFFTSSKMKKNDTETFWLVICCILFLLGFILFLYEKRRSSKLRILDQVN